MTNDKIPFAKLINTEDHLYRINAIPFVVRNAESNYNSHIEVSLSKLKDDLSFPLDYKDVLSKKSQDTSSKVETVNLTVGDLSGIRAGSVWRNGKEVVLEKEHDVFEIDINNETVTYLSSLNHNQGYSLIPKQYWPLGRAISSNFVAVDYNNDPYGLIIPSIELIQFYFGSSSRLNRAILNGGISELDKIISINDCGINQATGDVHITMRKEYPDLDAWILARILYSDIARDAALTPYNSLQTYFIQNPHHYYGSPKAKFPFVGKTELKAIVKKYKVKDQWRFFVLEIVSCTHSFGFKDVYVHRQNDARTNPDEDPQDRKDKTEAFANAQKQKDVDSNKNINSTQDPTNDIESITMNISKSRFPDLFGKKILKEEKLFTEYKSVLPKDELITEITGYSSGEPFSGNSESSPISVDCENETDEGRKKRTVLPSSFEQLHKLIDRISERFLIHHSFKSEADGFNENLPLFFFPDKTNGGNPIKWSYLPGNNTRCALLCCFKVKNKYVYFLEIQRNPKKEKEGFSTYIFAKNRDNTELEYEVLKELLYEIAIRTRSKRSYGEIFEDYKFKSLTHGFSTIENYLNSAINRILSVS